MKTAMTIAGVDSGGGAGIAADLKTFSALGVHGTCVITSLTAQNTKGVLNSFDIPTAFIKEQFDTVASDIKLDCVKTGMLSSPDIVSAVATLIKRQKLRLVIDPVMAAEAGGKLLKEEAVGVLIEELLPLAAVVTPNVSEAERLSGFKIRNMKEAEKAAKKIHDLGAKAVIVTGGHLEGTDILYTNGKFTYIVGDLVKGGTHGSGCTHSAALAAEIAKGTPLVEAAQLAKKFVEMAILAGVKIGGGAAPVNQVAHVLAEAERYHVLQNVVDAVEIIEKNMAVELIPEVGCNIAMGITNASSISDVAAVSGRIVRLKGKPHAVGCVAFGASSHVARIVLTAMQADGSMKASLNLRYSKEALSACNELGLRIATFSREDEPEGVSTMEWGVSEAINSVGRVPDAICDKGDVGKEAMIRLLGKDAKEVAGRAVEIGAGMRNSSYTGAK
ncbi:MAG: bifunctional hydroxymethylpyrimidine kinase/phosphomethylpyrimidine kinase [Candidatus Methanoperedens sp.]|nr:bifunctional hydroxymethylpyrimidine kinase/phosphomethylpyrimidine kinase [Candidatus Methanoperedens sp.]MCZ7395447.1 bifunctional hydroxymethylpyrimidine kinase/phosphomethylpyrimidine kinase [Candidatus Methanoperedens sp.]